MRQGLRTSLTSIFVCVFVWFSSAPAFCDSINAYPTHDGYIVTGGAIHHDNYSKSRDEAAKCQDCFWRILEICKSWQDESHRSCPWLRMQCPKDMQIVEVFRANTNQKPTINSGEWYFTGYSCIGESGPISTLDIASHLTDSWYLKLPELKIKYFPQHDAILRRLVKFDVLSDLKIITSKNILGNEVTVTAEANLSFTCSDFSNSTTCVKQFLNKIKLYQVGLQDVTAKTTWQATYAINQISGIPIAGTKPVFRFPNLFNVHPLFTHLAK